MVDVSPVDRFDWVHSLRIPWAEYAQREKNHARVVFRLVKSIGDLKVTQKLVLPFAS